MPGILLVSGFGSRRIDGIGFKVFMVAVVGIGFKVVEG